MEIRDNDKVCIIEPLTHQINYRKQEKIFNIIRNESRKIALDFKNLHNCSIEFIEILKQLKNQDISIFNIPSDIFVLFNIMNLDKHIKLYVSELDFEENARQLINRKFTII